MFLAPVSLFFGPNSYNLPPVMSRERKKHDTRCYFLHFFGDISLPVQKFLQETRNVVAKTVLSLVMYFTRYITMWQAPAREIKYLGV